MFHRVLVANRGEVACRVIRTCRALGMHTIAVFSEADRHALHVELADEAHLIGGSPVSQSYLNSEAILAVAAETKAEAVHPGYGLLSENAAFALACAERGFAFVGPAATTIADMGNKVRARAHALGVGFPVVPGSEAILGDGLDAARLVGFPLMVKASAGGGGIGMSRVQDEAALARALTQARSMATRAFGDAELYLERYLASARHVEVQILGDMHGSRMHLWHRECSVQRRHQKVVEEAPIPDVGAALSEALTSAALSLAHALDYQSAGTVECLLAPDGAFYFLEVNTRLQVEHAVTEMVTGVDVVEQQLRIAAGEPLAVAVEELNGHAIECRIYAEHPVTHMPSPGTITAMSIPEAEGVRWDAGYRAGDTVTPYYDPLIGKLVVWGEHRASARVRMAEVLEATHVEGITTNLPLLRDVVASEEFAAGQYDTNLIQRLVS